MALLWLDGFDYTATTAHIATLYNNPGSSIGVAGSSTGGRRSTRGVTINGSPGSPLIKALTPGDATCIVGIARSFDGPGNSDSPLLWVGDNTVYHMSLYRHTNGTLQFYRGNLSTALGSPSTYVFNVGAGYRYIEIKVTIADSGGIAVCRIDGTEVLNLSSEDTRNGGTAGWTKVGVAAPNFANSFNDDFYICDGTGSENNDFLGDVRVDAHYPNANGNSSMSTPSTGSDRYATVDENPPNGDTDYNTVVAANDKDTLGLQDLVNAGFDPMGVMVTAFARKTDAGVGNLAPVLRISGTDYDGTAQELDTSYRYIHQVYNRDPSNSVWSEATFNAMEVGYKRTA